MNEIFQLAQLVLAAQNKTAMPALNADAWHTLATLADTQRLSGYLFARLQKHPQRGAVPAPVLKHWHAYYMRQWAKNTRLAEEMARVQGQWRGEILFFKGPLLTQRLYGEIDARAISDLDVFIPSLDAYADADAQLRTLGYVRTSRVLFGARLSQQLTYHFEYQRGDIPLELHWNIHAHPSFHIEPRTLWQGRVRVRLGAQTFETLPLQDELVTAVAALPVDLQLNKLTLRALFETLLMAQQLGETFAWDEWFRERAYDGTQRVTYAAFDAVSQLFGAEELPRGVQIRLRNTLTKNVLLANFASMSLSARRRAAFGLYEYPVPASLLWWAFSLGGRVLAHPTETRRTWQRLKST